MNLFGNKWKDKDNPTGACLKDFNIKSYVKVYENAIPETILSKLNKLLIDNNKDWSKHTFHDNINDTYKTYDDDLDVMFRCDLDGQLLDTWTALMSETWNVI